MSLPILTTAQRVRVCAVLARALRHGAAYSQVSGHTQAQIRDLDENLAALERELAEGA